MEMLVVLLMIIVLCLCLGISLQVISIGFLIIINIMLIIMFGLFIWCLIGLASSKKCKAKFLRFDKNEKKLYDVAYYSINGNEYQNAFPREIVMRDRLYKENKIVNVRLLEKRKCVFDNNALLTVILGLVFSLGCAIGVLMQIMSLMK